VDEEVGSIGADFKVSFVTVEKKKIKIQIVCVSLWSLSLTNSGILQAKRSSAS
jgi:hypothetical protein